MACTHGYNSQSPYQTGSMVFSVLRLWFTSQWLIPAVTRAGEGWITSYHIGYGKTVHLKMTDSTCVGTHVLTSIWQQLVSTNTVSRFSYSVNNSCLEYSISICYVLPTREHIISVTGGTVLHFCMVIMDTSM